MRSIILLLLCAQSVISTFTSALFPNIWGRGSTVMAYTVFPTEAAHAVEIARTEVALKEACGDANVKPHRQIDGDGSSVVSFWTITSTENADLTAAIKAVEGVGSVEQNVSVVHPSLEPSHPALVRREIQNYTAIANLTEDVKKTEEFLKSKVQSGTEILYLKEGDQVIGWWRLALDPESFKAAQNYIGIKAIRVSEKARVFRALPSMDRTFFSHVGREPLTNDRDLFRRAEQWEKQVDADKALNFDSQFRGANFDSLTDFVHPPNPGQGSAEEHEGSVIYVIDQGVKLDSMSDAGLEFHPPGEYGGEPKNIRVLRTKNSEKAGQKEDTDESGHGTAVASKALGGKFGVAKKATLVVVKLLLEEEEFEEAYQKIADDIAANPGREHKSVVVITYGFGTQAPDELKRDRVGWKIHQPGLDALFKLGVPIVCAAGNGATAADAVPINHRPSNFLDDKAFPLIIVGGTEFDGSAWASSQGRNDPRYEILTVYAPSVGVACQGMTNYKTEILSGTSYAAPQIAGVIATYLAYDIKPWDDSKTGIERVVEIKNYLKSDKSSWERKPGVNAIWNGATQEIHRGAGANGQSAPPSQVSPPASPSPAPPPPSKTKALSIIWQWTQSISAGSGSSVISNNEWMFFATDRGVSVLCNNKAQPKFRKSVKNGAAKDGTPAWPAGTYEVKDLHGMNCEYKNDGKDNPGALWCTGMLEPIPCQADSMRWNKQMQYCEGNGSPQVWQQAIVFCEW